jgi:hypothetical protein
MEQMDIKKSIFIGMALAFFMLGFISLQRAMPDAKEERIYKAISVYSPYKFEKALGGLKIVNTKTGDKESPDAASVMHRMDELQKEWGKTHLKVKDNNVIVYNDDGVEITKIAFENPLEKKWVKKYYGLDETKKSSK